MNQPHTIKKHGGARKGAGRKRGLASKRTRITRSISLPIEMWHEIDRNKKGVNRSRWIEAASGIALSAGENDKSSDSGEKGKSYE